MTSTSRLLESYVRLMLAESAELQRLRVFDFDDTLAKTGSRVWVNMPDGSHILLLPGEFAIYEKPPGATYDFSEFEILVDPREYKWTGKILKSIYQKYGPSGVVILTARGVALPVQQFLKQAGFEEIEVIALGTANPQAKADWINDRIVRDGLHHVEFFDDSKKNIDAVRALQPLHPDVKIIVRHIVHREEAVPFATRPLTQR